MIAYLIKKDNELDFNNPLDVEHPFSFNLKTITPTTQIYLVEYNLINGEYKINYCLNKDPLIVVRSILNLYPNLIFDLSLEILSDDNSRLYLLKTCLRTIKKRHELKNNNNDDFEKFKKRYTEFVLEHNIGKESDLNLC